MLLERGHSPFLFIDMQLLSPLRRLSDRYSSISQMLFLRSGDSSDGRITLKKYFTNALRSVQASSRIQKHQRVSTFDPTNRKVKDA